MEIFAFQLRLLERLLLGIACSDTARVCIALPALGLPLSVSDLVRRLLLEHRREVRDPEELLRLHVNLSGSGFRAIRRMCECFPALHVVFSVFF